MSRLLSDPRLRIGAVVVAMAALAGIGLVIKPEKADTRAQAAVTEPARTVVNRTALSCPVLSPGGKMASVVNGVAPTLPEGTPTAPGTAEPLTIAPLPTTSNPVGSLLKRGTIGSSAVVVKPEPLSLPWPRWRASEWSSSPRRPTPARRPPSPSQPAQW